MSPTPAVSNLLPDDEVRLLLNPTAVLSPEHDFSGYRPIDLRDT